MGFAARLKRDGRELRARRGGGGAWATLAPAALTLAAALLAGCGSREEADRGPVEPVTNIQVSGAEAPMKLVEELAGEFSSRRPGAHFNFLPPGHTAGALRGTLEKALDVGVVSRELQASERSPELEEVYFCRDAVVFVAHPSSGVDGLTSDLVRAIYSGRIADWEEAGGARGPVIPIMRPPSTSGRLLLERLLFGEGFIHSPREVIIENSQETIEAVRGTPGSIGFAFLGSASREGGGFRVLSLDGVTPDEESVGSGSYPLVRTFGIVLRRDAPAPVKAFASYLRAEPARRVVRDSGFTPLQ